MATRGSRSRSLEAGGGVEAFNHLGVVVETILLIVTYL